MKDGWAIYLNSCGFIHATFYTTRTECIRHFARSHPRHSWRQLRRFGYECARARMSLR